MLTIEKKHDGKGIAITMGKRNRFFTTDTMRAFAAAILFHVLALVIFKVSMASADVEVIHRPITVGADMSDAIAVTGSTSSVSIDAGGLLPRHISEPEASVPEAPPIPVSTITMATKHNKEDTLVEGIFWQTEHIAEMPSHEDFAYATEYSPVTVAVSGTLASCAVIDDGLATIRSRSLRHGDTSYYTVSYAVAVENKKGKVFWSDAIEKAPSHSINAIARNIIETMVFDVEDVVTEGIVNITFEIEDDADDIISELYSEGVLALFNE